MPTVLKNFSGDPHHPGFYVTPVGLGNDPDILGKKFDVLYTYYPNNGQGWAGASVRRLPFLPAAVGTGGSAAEPPHSRRECRLAWPPTLGKRTGYMKIKSN